MNRIKSFFSLLLQQYHKDKIAFVLKTIAFSLLTIDLITMPSFTSRPKLNIVTNCLSIASSISIIIYLIFRGRLVINYFTFLILIFLVYLSATSLINKINPVQILTIHGFAFLLFEFVSNTKATGWFIKTYIIGSIIFMFVFYFYVIKDFSQTHSLQRFGSELSNVNAVARQLMFGFGLMLYLLLKSFKKYFIFLPFILLSFIGIVLTQSRGGLIASICLLLIQLYFQFGKKHKIWYFSILGFAVSIFVILFFSVQPFQKLINRFVESLGTLFGDGYSFDGSTFARIQMFFLGLKMWSLRLFTGWGYEGFVLNTAYGFYSHSEISEILCNFGIIGAITKFLPFFYLLYLAFKQNDKQSTDIVQKILIPFGISIVLLSFFVVIYKDKYTLFPLFFLFAIDFITNEKKQTYLDISIRNKRVTFSLHRSNKYVVSKNDFYIIEV